MKSYEEAAEILKNRQSRKLGNNTYLVKEGNDICVRLHETNIVTYRPNGYVILNSGGWQTNVTKDRLNQYSPVYITQERGVWYVDGDTVFADGMQIDKNGKLSGGGNLSEVKDLQKAVSKFVDDFIGKLQAGEVDLPDAGDCFYCIMKEEKTNKPLGHTNHIKSHIEESYFVPSMLFNAIEAYPVSPIAHDWLIYQMRHEENKLALMQDAAIRQIKSSLRRYIKHSLKLAS